MYIIDHGVCIYSYEFKPVSLLNEDLLVGFLASMDDLAQVAFQEGVQDLQIKSGYKLSFYMDVLHNLLYCAVCSGEDDTVLLSNILREIADAFSVAMHSRLESNSRTERSAYWFFDDRVPKILEGRVKARDQKSMALGLTLGMAVIIGLMLAFLPFVELFLDDDDPMRPIAFIIDACAVVLVANLVSGYLAGNPRRGVHTSLVLLVLSTVVLSLIWEISAIIMPSTTARVER